MKRRHLMIDIILLLCVNVAKVGISLDAAIVTLIVQIYCISIHSWGRRTSDKTGEDYRTIWHGITKRNTEMLHISHRKLL